ncbi:MAG: hypothetical protein IJI14_02870 [Anaerolineaceae bacterium]|nr:hypothetical protein [Anaerolineaceae bacterium]
MSLITIFITPKAFDREHIALIQRNAIRSWKALGADVDILLIGDDAGVEENAKALGVRHIRDVKRNSSGTPMLDDIFRIARENSDSPLLAYVNADIILKKDFVQTARSVMERETKFLLVGQRWDLDVQVDLEFPDGWEDAFDQDLTVRGRRHPAGGSDYFIYPRDIFTSIPPFAIGRSGWDNWMFYEARLKGWKLINCSKAINIIHQDHDYAHLPNGLPHYRQPESAENVKAAGGKRTIFTLLDCNYELDENGNLKKPAMSKKKLLRELEIFPLVTLKSKALGNASFALFHPKNAYSEFRNRSRS